MKSPSCVYCGMVATQRDHLRPLSLSPARTSDGRLVPACAECNLKLSNFPKDTVAERALCLLERYIPDWGLDSTSDPLKLSRISFLCLAAFYPHVCPTCKKSFEKRANSQIYCSKTCDPRYFKKEYISVACPTCKKQFKKQNSNSQIYCSVRCRPSYKDSVYTITCVVCEHQFKSKWKYQIYCNQHRSNNGPYYKYETKYKNKQIVAVCITCQEQFKKQVHNQIYCSRTCVPNNYRKEPKPQSNVLQTWRELPQLPGELPRPWKKSNE